MSVLLRSTVTENGAVQGYPGSDARITVYKGIPYAAPTSGENRWRAPQPVENWEGVRKCYEFGPITMQKIPGEDPNAFYSKEWHVDPEVPMGEDSLRVNIWTPAKSVGEKLPVMIWIFGGAFKEGYAHEMEFDGERIASRGVILVSVAYRVNAFGFLAHPEITAEDPENPTNFGLLDQLAGFKWVKRNIANFGGDPDNITIFGQSAGGGSVYAQLASPKSVGAFEKAIIQSAGGINFVYPKSGARARRNELAAAEQLGKKFFEEYLGVKTLAEARKLDAWFIEQKFLESGMMLGPVADGKFLLEDPSVAAANDRLQKVPFMIGNTTDEFMMVPTGDTVAEINEWIKANFPEGAAEEYMEIVKNIAGDDPVAYKKAASISSFQLATQLGLEKYADQGRNPYYYIFSPTIPGDNAGAFHSADLWFEFETLMKCWRPFDGHHFDLARKMCNYWTNFAKKGNPNGNDADGTPMPEWTPFTAESRQNIQFFDEISMSSAPEYDAKRKFLLDLNLKELGLK